MEGGWSGKLSRNCHRWSVRVGHKIVWPLISWLETFSSQPTSDVRRQTSDVRRQTSDVRQTPHYVMISAKRFCAVVAAARLRPISGWPGSDLTHLATLVHRQLPGGLYTRTCTFYLSASIRLFSRQTALSRDGGSRPKAPDGHNIRSL